MFKYLYDNDIISNNNEIIHRGTRDDPNIDVLQCIETSCIFLNKNIHTNYEIKSSNYWNVDTIEKSLEKTFDDDYRRSKFITNNNCKVLDFGCGNGGFLSLLDDNIIKYGIDLNIDSVTYMNTKNIIASCDINTIPTDITFDYITLFHVLEHLSNPIEILNQLKPYMNDNTILIIEVPSAQDILLNKYNCESFKKFTFWSEHLVLYTEQTLFKLLSKNNFQYINIEYEQRYNIFNHLHWLSYNKPGGHNIWQNDEQLNNSYVNYLKENQCTDTLIAYCKL
jgi:SAM-dependent methyltransferase